MNSAGGLTSAIFVFSSASNLVWGSSLILDTNAVEHGRENPGRPQPYSIAAGTARSVGSAPAEPNDKMRVGFQMSGGVSNRATRTNVKVFQIEP